MYLISLDSGKNRIFSAYYPCIWPLTQENGQRKVAAELQEVMKDFEATSGLYLCHNGLLSILGLGCFSLLLRSRRYALISIDAQWGLLEFVKLLWTTPLNKLASLSTLQCNLDYPDPFVHRLSAAIPDKWNVRITEVPTFLTRFMIPSL